MSASSPFDDDEVGQPANRAELPADDLKDNSHRAEAVQSLHRTSQAQPDNPVEMQAKNDDLAQRAAHAMAIPVPEAESVVDAGLQV